jgi:hypothetical protein
MQSKTLIALIAAATMGVSSTAMAGKGGGGGHGMMGHNFNHHFPNFRNHFLRNQAFFGNGWGWGGWGWPYEEGGNTTVVNFPSAIPGAADVTGSTSPPCRLQAETFTVPAAAGGTKPVEIVGCR